MAEIELNPIVYGANERSAVKGIRQYITPVEFGAKGDGSQSSPVVAANTAAFQAALDAAFVDNADSASVSGNSKLKIPPGTYYIDTAALIIPRTLGAMIIGSGRFTTKIINLGAGGSIFKTQAFSFGKITNMYLGLASGAGVAFDLDWDGNTPGSLQSNEFTGVRTFGGAYGLRIGNTGFMGSENLISNCFFADHSEAGVYTGNYNALQNTIVGGNIARCKIGVHVFQGSVANILGTGFQANTEWDVRVDNSAGDSIHVDGARTESVHFVRCHYKNAVLTACSQRNETAGTFLEHSTGSAFCIDGCSALNGRIVSNYGGGDIRSSQFGRDDWLSQGNGSRINVSKVQSGKTAVGQGTGTAVLREHGYFVDGSYTAYS